MMGATQTPVVGAKAGQGATARPSDAGSSTNEGGSRDAHQAGSSATNAELPISPEDGRAAIGKDSAVGGSHEAGTSVSLAPTASAKESSGVVTPGDPER